MLTPVEQLKRERGEQLKRLVRSHAAARGIYEDTDLADHLGISRVAIGKWWAGKSVPSVESLGVVAALLGLEPDALVRCVYFGGELPIPRVDPRQAALQELEDERGSNASPRRPRDRLGSGER